jgi:thiamine kinase
MCTRMATPRPLEIESLLDSWQALGWPFRTRPELIRALSGGCSNRSYLLEADGQRCVLRLGRAEPAAPGIDRAREADIVNAATAAGLAPRLLHVDLTRDLFLSAAVDGRHFTLRDLDRAMRQALLDKIAQIHALPVTATRLDYRAHYLALGRLAGAITAALPTDLAHRLDRIERACDRGLCHHDPGPGNVLFRNGTPIFIDWEYAAPGLPVFDYAALVCDWKMPLVEVSAHADIPPDLMEDACTLYAQLCRWWLHSRGDPA